MKVEEKLPVPVKSFYSIVVKRVLDVLLSAGALLVLSPLLLVVSVLEVVYHGFPILYATERPGKDGKIIKIYKFRSMTNERDENGFLLADDQRVTKFGKLIRKLSIDELPELWSILKGDMSIIGPRPLLIEYLDLYSHRHAMRHSVRPGLACVRINKNDTSTTWTWREQFENDIYYIEHISFITDVKMIIAVLKETIRGAEYRVNGTRVPFLGDNLDDTRSSNELEEKPIFQSLEKVK